MNYGWVKRLNVFMIAVLVVCAYASSAGALTSTKSEPFSKPSGVTIRIAPKAKGAVDLSTAMVKVAKETMPAVVYIEVTESREVTNPFGPFQNDPFFKRFFGSPKMPPKFKQEMKGLGSGMIIDPQGYILTNFHVAGSATKMEVFLADGSRHAARLVGGDSKTDLAVIRYLCGKAASSTYLW